MLLLAFINIKFLQRMNFRNPKFYEKFVLSSKPPYELKRDIHNFSTPHFLENTASKRFVNVTRRKLVRGVAVRLDPASNGVEQCGLQCPA
ncbi:hypothetical protein AVEN_229014-1 [Araneus ventricosus]|uniref:Uncharacterized protein n=1 Tax=Araneus ventricosus TaxID=182803 RepID=A0A4Y2KKX4_ARAVE|nr:hypothetical protein AVEN_229014-1 [Araneus ventricosus]